MQNELMDPRKKALVDAMGGNTGIGGTPDTSQLSAPPSAPSAPDMPPSPFQADAGPGPVAPPVSAPDKSKWNTDGYASPGYTAKAGVPSLGSGWDEQKWNDPNHQSPKYVFGRILQEASGGTGSLKDPAQREQAVGNILQAYPGATFDGKDKITMPDGGVIDIFGSAGSGDYKAAFQVEPGTGKDASGNPIDTGSPGAPQGGGGMFGGSTINPMLQGNAQDGIQQALSGLTQRSPKLEELLAALSGGGQ